MQWMPSPHLPTECYHSTVVLLLQIRTEVFIIYENMQIGDRMTATVK